MVSYKNTRYCVFALGAMLLTALLLLAGCGGPKQTADVVVRGGSGATGAPKATDTKANAKYTVYLITMDQGSPFWQQIDAGCRQAVDEIGDIAYKWIAPRNHASREQGECIDQAVAAGANAIVISAISPTETNENLKRAAAAGVKIVYVDAAATVEGVATLMTDNLLAGRIAGETMQKALAAAGIRSGEIGLAAMGKNQNATLRDQGFREAFRGTGFTVAPTVYLDNDRQNIKNFVRDHPDYVGFFGSNGQTTFAIAEQVKESGIKPVVIGFDTADFTMQMLQEGVIYATLQQLPTKMGLDGLTIAVKALKGEFKETNVKIDMGVNVITKDKL